MNLWLTIQIVVGVDTLNNILYKTFISYLHLLNIGHSHDAVKISHLMNLVNSVDYVQNNKINKQELRNIIRHYENC